VARRARCERAGAPRGDARRDFRRAPLRVVERVCCYQLLATNAAFASCAAVFIAFETERFPASTSCISAPKSASSSGSQGPRGEPLQ
jgi:hypothetical protein